MAIIAKEPVYGGTRSRQLGDHPNSEQVLAWMEKQSAACNRALDEARECALRYGEAKRLYKVAHAQAVLRARRDGYTDEHGKTQKVGSVKEAEAVADVATGQQLQDYVEAETLYQAAIEAARMMRAELSSIQTYVGMVRSEMDLAGRGPQVTP